MVYVIEPTQKKSVVETTCWTNNETSETITIEVGWRGGCFVIPELGEDETPPDDPIVIANKDGFNVYSYEYAELDNTYDGCWEIITLTDSDGTTCDNSSDEDNPLAERLAEIEEGWYEDSYTYMEENGWYDEDSETWIYGPLQVTIE